MAVALLLEVVIAPLLELEPGLASAPAPEPVANAEEEEEEEKEEEAVTVPFPLLSEPELESCSR